MLNNLINSSGLIDALFHEFFIVMAEENIISLIFLLKLLPLLCFFYTTVFNRQIIANISIKMRLTAKQYVVKKVYNAMYKFDHNHLQGS